MIGLTIHHPTEAGHGPRAMNVTEEEWESMLLWLTLRRAEDKATERRAASLAQYPTHLTHT